MHGFKLVIMVVLMMKHVFSLSTLYYPKSAAVKDRSLKPKSMSNMREKVLLFCLRHSQHPLCQKKSQRDAIKAARKEEGIKSSKTVKPSKESRINDGKGEDTETKQSSTTSISSNSMVCQFTTKAEFLMFKMAVKVAKNEAIDVGKNLKRIKALVKDLVSLPRAFMKCKQESSETVMDGEFLLNVGEMISKKKSTNVPN